MNDSRFPVFRSKHHKGGVSSSSLLPLMEERRVFKPPLTSRSASGQGSVAKSSRLPKPSSSSRPTISRPISQLRPTSSTHQVRQPRSSSSGKQTLLATTSLPYLDQNPRSSGLDSSTPSKRTQRLSTRSTNLPSTSQQVVGELVRPRSFPPLHHSQKDTSSTRLPPPNSTPSNSSLDPFKIHANRILRPSARTSCPSSTSAVPARHDLRDSSCSLPPPPRSSSLTTTSSLYESTPSIPKYRPQQPRVSSPSLLRRTATVRSATSTRRKPSISGMESFVMMARNSSNGGSNRRVRGPGEGVGVSRKREEEVWEGLIEEESVEEELIGHWKAFVGAKGGVGGGGRTISSPSSPLIDQLPPPSPSFESPPLGSVPTTSKTSSSTRILSISSTPRELSQTLPQLNRYLHTRTASHPNSLVLDLERVGGEGGEGMTRVDSEVLLTRLTLKRLGSTGFEGDALDKLGRNEEDDLRNLVVQEEEEKGEEESDGMEDWADRYRDIWNEETIRPISPPSPTYSSSSTSSSNSSSSSRSSFNNRKAWKWNPSSTSSSTTPSSSSSCSIGGGGLPHSESSSTMSSSTSIGTLSMMSRNWSKSSLMEELEKQVGRLSTATLVQEIGEWEGDFEEDDGYVCALDLIFEDESEEEEAKEREIPVRRGGAPLLSAPILLGSTAPAPAIPLGVSRLPRPKPSVNNLRQQVEPSPVSALPVPVVPRGFVSKLAQPSSVANKFVVSRGTGRGTKSKAGWL